MRNILMLSLLLVFASSAYTWEWCKEVNRSSFIEGVCYDQGASKLGVMISGKMYSYCNISPTTVSSFVSAPSMGRYFNANIKGRECY